ncbi:hypothetical protein HRR99_07315 [Agrobacterium vaccinii]|uniref:hypothetical protein n=1 Tax=Agrobacterium vaccinii TaxID=2735528 RepID=UPI001E3BA223|nr:hypothetical protein [Agrobacterium vaccinii]UHS61334.1 hypothetical protein HRR99_07315 [Agrobacterium vaccinii]
MLIFNDESLTFEEAGDRTDVAWIRPTPPTGYIKQRKPKEKGSVVGNDYAHRFNRALSYASGLESKFTMMLLADRHVVDLREQWPKLWYWRPGARTQNWTVVDHYAVYDTGFRIAYSVKASEFLGESEAFDIRDLVREQLMGDKFDEYVVLTEEQITDDKAANAEDIVVACSNRNDCHCALVMEFMRTIVQPISFLAVERTLPPEIDVRNSLLCLIYDGLVEHLSPEQAFDDAPFIQTIIN